MDYSTEMHKVALRLAAEMEIRHDEDGEWEAIFDLKLENGRSQAVTVSPETRDERLYMRVMTTVGDSAQFGPDKLRQMLQLNASLIHGAFALNEGKVVLTTTLEGTGFDSDHAARVTGQIARTADQMEQAFFGTDRA